MAARARDEADARAAAMRKRPDVRVYHRSIQAPYKPVIQINLCVDILELLSRREESKVSTDERPVE